MKQIQVKISPREWAEKRLQLSSSFQIENIDFIIESCGFILDEETAEQPKETDELPTDKVERVKYFLNKLPDGYRERALAQVDKDRVQEHKIVDNTTKTLEIFTRWSKTKEGSSFWLKVLCHYETNEPLPQLPTE